MKLLSFLLLFALPSVSDGQSYVRFVSPELEQNFKIKLIDVSKPDTIDYEQFFKVMIPENMVITDRYLITFTKIQTVFDNMIATYEPSSNWTRGPATVPGWYLNTTSFSNVKDAFISLEFFGPKLSLYGEFNDRAGIAGVSIDGGPETLCDLYSNTSLLQRVFFSSVKLSNILHVCKIRVTGTKNIASKNTFVLFDFFVVR